jgi:hypothetical protein
MKDPTENRVSCINQPGATPKAIVFTNSTARLMTPAEAKRARFVKSLKTNYLKLNEALAFFDFFATVCELSLESREGVHKANQKAIAELAAKFEKKLADYNKRTKEAK